MNVTFHKLGTPECNCVYLNGRYAGAISPIWEGRCGEGEPLGYRWISIGDWCEPVGMDIQGKVFPTKDEVKQDIIRMMSGKL